MFSLNSMPLAPPTLISDGTRVASAMPTSGRNAPRRATSVTEPPPTFGTPAAMPGSTPSRMVP